jgi:hypothetical protein
MRALLATPDDDAAERAPLATGLPEFPADASTDAPASEPVPQEPPAPEHPSILAYAAGYRWTVDHFAVSPNAIHFYGWCAHPSERIARMVLELQTLEAGTLRLDVPYGNPRPDVPSMHPELPEACGFYLYTGLQQAVGRVRMMAITADGAEVVIDVLQEPALLAPPPPMPLGRKMRLRRAAEDWAHRLVGWTRPPDPEAIGEDGIADYTQRPLREFLLGIGRNTLLIVDHDMGGGANVFRESVLSQARAKKRNILLWTFSLSKLRFQLRLYRRGELMQTAWVGMHVWEALAQTGKVKQLYFNNCVSYPEPEQVSSMLLRFCRDTRAKVTLFVHDFHMVCPSSFLLDDTGRFCGVPDRKRCRECLPRSDQQMVNLYRSRDIDSWRARWIECLREADEIVCFSDNSKALLLRAYPELARRRIKVRPHAVPPMAGKHRYPREPGPLRIGVVGSIGVHKGSEVILALAERIAARELPVEIHVIGALNTPHRHPLIHQTGPYERARLADLLNEHGVHLAFVPSICAETFSFVTHELIALGAPLVAFDLGAQGDAARAYARGRVIEQGPADRILDDILSFKADLDREAGLSHPVNTSAASGI